MESNQRDRRRIKLPKPGLQLRLVGAFVGLTALGFLIQSLLLGMFLAETSARMPEGGTHLMAELPGLPIRLVLVTLGLVLPLVFAVGVLITFRIAGPVYRFEQYLTSVLRGEQLGPCRLRKGDELGGLCEIINRVTEPLRTGRPHDSAADAPMSEIADPVAPVTPSEGIASDLHGPPAPLPAGSEETQEGMRAAG